MKTQITDAFVHHQDGTNERWYSTVLYIFDIEYFMQNTQRKSVHFLYCVIFCHS